MTSQPAAVAAGMSFSKQELKEMAAAVPFWFHSIELGQGVTTNGLKSVSKLAGEVRDLQLPDLRGKSVLDINAWDGFFSFEAERRGAARVVALDQYMWSMDLAEHLKYYTECNKLGVAPAPYHTMPYYKPDELPGKVGFDTAHRARQSKVEVVVGDFMEMDLAPLGQFDVVFYLGSLYHMENPLQAMRRVASVTRELAIVETEAVAFPNFEQHSLCEFFESDELMGDVSNWWAPNDRALAGMCRAAGFSRVDTVVGNPLSVSGSRQNSSVPRKLLSAARSAVRELSAPKRLVDAPEVIRYRGVVHAWK
jgi:tRNA (mo5U34)-methyltransferase